MNMANLRQKNDLSDKIEDDIKQIDYMKKKIIEDLDEYGTPRTKEWYFRQQYSWSITTKGSTRSEF